MHARVDQLERHFEMIDREQMRGLPIVNDRLSVEAIGFREFSGHDFGVLLTPWFMNLFLLPGDDEWDGALPGSKVEVALPSGGCEFVVSRDDRLGTCLSAILFRTVTDFPDQRTARAIARTALAELLSAPAARADRVSRRSFIQGRGAAV